jgi:hypothetical protein
MSFLLNGSFEGKEFLYRGVVKVNWDIEKARPTSAIFKDSQGISVDREAGRPEKECVDFLLKKRHWKAIAKVKVQDVVEMGATVLYKPEIPDNIYHSEIHDSTSKITLSGSKSAKLRDRSEIIYFDDKM